MLNVRRSSGSARATCAHCGTPFVPRLAEAYCCHGCEYVARVLSDNDLTRFYELKGATPVPPVGSKAFLEVEAAPLVAEMQRSEALSGKPVAGGRFGLEGISCIGCVWLIEAIFQRQSGSARVRIDPRSSAVELHWQRGHFDIAAFARELQKTGYRLSLYCEDPAARSGSRQISHRLGLCAFFLLNTMLFTLPKYLGMESDFFLAPLFKLLAATFATLSMIIGGGLLHPARLARCPQPRASYRPADRCGPARGLCRLAGRLGHRLPKSHLL